ncbi:phosphate acyltransferase PlsX [Wenxinia marina]|uniref:Phosphate acyltransferase n=1 Tax=Wenxinia marina DSM 24838 TaxID=1123501 RepID=A0A0D0NHP0_9RHOB|nr:phosphate acyltransferase PlsX [Wenxinia marina]KIQ67865.1 phosphate:acyl-[acyl carrier protein] acyltransferase [Wenxinia marina DSM 24838]GGL74452.1 phosphate acyltransferase [Wenxinia marina]
MTTPSDRRPGTGDIVLSVDAMGGDKGPAAVVAGLKLFLDGEPDARVLLHGRAAELEPEIARRGIGGAVTIVDAAEVVSMDDKPAQVMRRGKGTSMWSAIDAVRDGRAQACVSCGNTGALMAVSMLRLRKLDGVDRPAIAALWPSRSPAGFNVVLDMGADIRADEQDLLAYALMGASYARNGLGIERPRVGLLNVGTEEHKGRAELKVAHEIIGRVAPKGGYDYIGFVEGSDLPSDRVDVIVTDGFTGNVALKTGEGTARLVIDQLRAALTSTPLAAAGAFLARGALRRLQERIDPRRVNGGVFLGLAGTVIKSHGSSDETGVAAALGLAYRLAGLGFAERLAARVASAAALAQDAASGGPMPPQGDEDAR